MERRSSARYRPEGVRIFIGWYHPQGFDSRLAELVNISLGGALIRGAGLPSSLSPVWIRLAGHCPDYDGWVTAEVVEASDAPAGTPWMRLSFAGFCPYDFFKAVVFPEGKPGETPRPDGPSGRSSSFHRAAAAAQGCVSESLPDASATRQQAQQQGVVQSPPAPTNHLRAALAARENGRFHHFRGAVRTWRGNP